MTTLTDAFRPTALLGQIFGDQSARPGVVAGAVERLAEEGFYQGLGIRPIADPTDRRRIAAAVRDHGIMLTYWLTLLLNDEGLNLSAPDQALRRKSVARARACLDAVAECGTRFVGIGSGPDPGPGLRAEATERLLESMAELAEAAWDCGEMHLMIEPFDRGAHKNGLIGPTAECVALFRRLRDDHKNACISWDTAHAALNGEGLLESLAAVEPYVQQMHMANAVLDRDDPQFGDWHMPIGPPGFLTVERIAGIFAHAGRLGLFGKEVGLAMEQGTRPGEDPWDNERRGRRTLLEAWDLYRSRAHG